ncbi:MAG: hypothetical protein ACR2LL_05305 [Nitrosopumilus sp.]
MGSWMGPVNYYSNAVTIPYGLVSAIAAEVFLAVYLMRRWVKKWNRNFNGPENRDSTFSSGT